MAFYRSTVRTYEGDECILWPYRRDHKGYARLWVEGKSRIVSRLVCEEHHGRAPSKDHHAAHSCGKGHLGCVTKAHLSWKTAVENAADMVVHGTKLECQTHPMAKLTNLQVSAIRVLRGKFLQREIADMFGVDQVTVSKIQIGLSWKGMG